MLNDTFFVRLPYELLNNHSGFVEQHRPGLEIFISSPTLDSASTGELSSRIRGSLPEGLPLTLHGPFMDLSPGAVDEHVRIATSRRFGDVLDIAGRVGALSVVFHSGYEKWKYAHELEPWLGNSKRFWAPLIEQAERVGTRIAIENIFEEGPEPLSLLMGTLHSESFGICFDTGHFNLFSSKPLNDWLGDIGSYIIEYHLHDNRGDADSHLPPGDGDFDFSALFKAMRGQEIIHTIEANSPEDTLLSIERLSGLPELP